DSITWVETHKDLPFFEVSYTDNSKTFYELLRKDNATKIDIDSSRAPFKVHPIDEESLTFGVGGWNGEEYYYGLYRKDDGSKVEGSTIHLLRGWLEEVYSTGVESPYFVVSYGGTQQSAELRRKDNGKVVEAADWPDQVDSVVSIGEES